MKEAIVRNGVVRRQNPDLSGMLNHEPDLDNSNSHGFGLGLRH